MTGVLRAIKDCNRYATREPVKADLYLARTGMAWMACYVLLLLLFSDSSSLGMKEIMAQALLLSLMVASCRFGRLPAERIMMINIVTSCVLVGASTGYILMEYEYLKTELLLADWKLYLYVFLTSAAWMFMFFVDTIFVLCRRNFLAEGDGWRIYVYTSLIKKSDKFCVLGLFLAFPVIFIYTFRSLHGVWITFYFAFPLLMALWTCRLLLRYRILLQSIGEIE